MQWLNKLKALLQKGNARQEYFLALIFKERSIKATLFEEQESRITLVDSAQVATEKALDDLTDDDLLKYSDQAIGLAEKSLPTTVKTTKVIFGLNEWWVEGTSIKQPYFTKIRKVAKELNLTPLGFVVISEAIVHLLKKQEGTPPTILLVSLGQDRLGVTLVRSGRIEKAKTVVKEGKRDCELAAEVLKAFGDVEVLPSRILLFDGQVELEEAKQEFIAYQWTKELPFLHFPKIDMLPEDTDSEAVITGAAKEMGLSFREDVSVTEEEPSSFEESTTAPPALQEVKSEDEEPFGFVKDRDVAEKLLIQEEDSITKQALPLESSPAGVAQAQISSLREDLGRKPEPEGEVTKKVSTPKPISHFVKTIAFGISSTISPLFSVKDMFARFSIRTWLPLLATFLVLMGASFAAFITLPTASLVLTTQTRALEKDVEILVDTNATSVDNESKKIPAKLVESKQDGEKSQKTTGKKTVGEKAKGEVIIYNKTENKKTFPRGTVLLGTENLRFALDEEVTVASTAAFELTPSSAKAKVIAEQIGEESNIAAGANLPFKEFPTSSYFAKNEVPFTGGTKREIVVVNKEDQENLLKALIEELQNKAKEELKHNTSDNRIVEDTIKEEIVSKKYSEDVGDEVDTVSLILTVSFSTLSYKDSDLLELIGSEIEKAVPNGFVFQKENFETSVKSIGKEKSGVLPLIVHYKALLVPKLDVDSIKKAIVGKSKSAVERYLENLPLEDFTISSNIALPAPFDLLPWRVENVKIEIQPR